MIKKYNISGGYKGIDDLQNIYAFKGNSQGDESCSNEILDYLASKGWMSFHFDKIDKTNQEAIYEESLRRQKANEIYIQKCKTDGTYGQYLGDIQLQMIHNPLFDDSPSFSAQNSYSIVILDLSK